MLKLQFIYYINSLPLFVFLFLDFIKQNKVIRNQDFPGC
jgi:hypothetical protein